MSQPQASHLSFADRLRQELAPAPPIPSSVRRGTVSEESVTIAFHSRSMFHSWEQMAMANGGAVPAFSVGGSLVRVREAFCEAESLTSLVL